MTVTRCKLAALHFVTLHVFNCMSNHCICMQRCPSHIIDDFCPSQVTLFAPSAGLQALSNTYKAAGEGQGAARLAQAVPEAVTLRLLDLARDVSIRVCWARLRLPG